ncbi:MAG: LptF/LptG family permease, partial [Gammaproteobacteria bacterium]|nr:LptF/LptG family permease [Gammaproteobacteria bacterium]
MVVTFVMSIGIVFKVTDLLAQGVAWKPMVRILFFGFPQAFALAIPVSTLTACLLLFGRLSADGEITAMKANGVSVW